MLKGTVIVLLDPDTLWADVLVPDVPGTEIKNKIYIYTLQ